ncbi:MAG TPA: hypothetical protein EYM39_04605 [Candidatus Latescibacteria bacterium]|nr:hypothetical protein [Candidatus Latescibacterota bacterium]
MSLFHVSIGLTVFANVLYHLFQKEISSSVHPLVSLMVTYGVALAVCAAMLPFYPHETAIAVSLRKLNWASFALALAIVGLEMGFLLAYRSGWGLSLAAMSSNVAVAVLLVPVGLLAYRESLSAANALGVVLCIVGLILVSHDPIVRNPH